MHPTKLRALTGVRFFAAAMIVALHLGGNDLRLPPEWVAPLSHLHLEQGVPLFFVLSGFILFYNYSALESGAERWRFMLARFARLWPVHAMTLAMVLLALPATALITNDARHMIASLMLVQSWMLAPDFALAYNGPSWSVATEFGLYFFFLILVPDFERTFLLKLAVSIGLAAIFIKFVDAAIVLQVHPVTNLFGFTCGMTAAVFWKRGVLKPANRLSASVLELSALALFLTNGYISHELIPYLPSGIAYWLSAFGSPSLTGTFLIFMLAHGDGVLSSFLATRPIVLLGEISYSMYLLHAVILCTIAMRGFYPFSPGWNLIAYLVAVLVSSFVMWLTVEKPGRKFIVSLPAILDRGRPTF